MKHFRLETRSAIPLETRADDPNPIEEATRAVTELRTAFDQRMAGLDEITTRLDALEARGQRPGPTDDRTGAAETERRALASFIRTGAETEIRAATSSNDPAGGYFVLPTIDTTIRDIMRDISPMRALADVVTISGGSYERFYSNAARGASWVGESGARPQDTNRPTLIKHEYPVMELYAAPVTTRQLLEDSSIDIAAWLINDATRDFAETEGETFLVSDGTGGKPRGLLDYGTTNEKDFTRAWGKHQYLPALHASAPTDANLATACTNIVAALRRPYKMNATWLMHSTTAARLMGIKDSDGRRLWAPTGNLIEGVEHPLLGYPVEIDDGMPQITDAAGAHILAFGDFRQGYVVVDRQGVRIERDAVTQKGKIVFDTYKRVGGGAGDFNAIKFVKIAAT